MMMRSFMMSGIILLNTNAQSASYTSKWDRVDALAHSLVSGKGETVAEAARRLQVKEDILSILYEQEPGYPIYYVDAKAKGNNNGTSWANAFNHIQDAVDAAHNNGEGWVWVAAGSYTNDTEFRKEIQVDGYTLKGVVQLLPRVMLFGGFSGNETELSQRDPEYFTTIIQGYVGNSLQSPGLRGVDMGHQTLIDGFLIQKSGFDDDLSLCASNIDGGGIKTRRWFSIIRNNRITQCYAKNGGAIGVMYYENQDRCVVPDIEQYRQDYTCIVENNLIYRNHAVCGAGVQIRNVEALFCHNMVVYNSHDHKGDEPIKHKGIEIYITNNVSDRPVLANNIVWGNALEYGAIWLNIYRYYDGGLHLHDKGWYGFYNFVQTPTNYAVNNDNHDVFDEDPLFVDVNTNNFELQSTSPCIGAGLPLPDGTPTDVGFYEDRYLLTIDDGGIGANKTGEGYQFAGTTVTISTDSVFTDDAGTTKYFFERWEGTGSGAYVGDVRTADVLMNSNIEQKIIWKLAYKLEVNSGAQADQMSGWYNDKSQIQIVVPSRLNETELRRVFSHWEIHKNGSITTSTDTSLVLSMTAPISVTAIWDTEYRVRIITDHGSSTPSGIQWIKAGNTLQVSVETLVSGTSGVRYQFQQWQGNGVSAYSGANAAFSITVNGPVDETALWQTEYYLSVVSESGRGSPQGQNWYPSGATATISVDSLVISDNQNQYRFSKWIGNVYSGTDCTHEIVITNPTTQTVVWNHECLISVSVTPVNSGVVTFQNAHNGWGVVGSQVTVLAEGDPEQGYGLEAWSGAFSGRTNPLIFQVTAPVQLIAHFAIGDVRIETDPSGLSILANDASYTCPRIFYWLPGEKYKLDVATPQQTAPLLHYVFDHWSDGQARQHLITIPANPIVYTAFFKPEYAVIVNTDHGASSVKGSGWYESGKTVTISIDSLVEETNGTRYRFTKWTGLYQDSTSHIAFPIENGAVENAHWLQQHFLNAIASPGYGGYVDFNIIGPWYDHGTVVQLTAVPRDTHFTFTGWAGDIQSNEQQLPLTMDHPYNVTAQFTTSSLFPPEISGFPDTTLFEDACLVFSRARLEKIVTDKNDPIDSLQFHVRDGDPFTAYCNGEGLILTPDKDWNGTAEVILEVIDPWELMAMDTMTIHVIETEDKPGAFSLLHPSNASELPDSSEFVTFRWESSLNVDTGDHISYQLYIGSDSTFKVANTYMMFPSIQDTFLVLNRSMIHSNVYWGVRALDQQGYTTWAEKRFYLSVKTFVQSQFAGISQFSLLQNYPNPFNSTTMIAYQLPRRSHVQARIYDARGREICTLVNADQEAGQYLISWSGKDEYGTDVSSGIYFVKVSDENKAYHKKMLLVR